LRFEILPHLLTHSHSFNQCFERISRNLKSRAQRQSFAGRKRTKYTNEPKRMGAISRLKRESQLRGAQLEQALRQVALLENKLASATESARRNSELADKRLAKFGRIKNTLAELTRNLETQKLAAARTSAMCDATSRSLTECQYANEELRLEIESMTQAQRDTVNDLVDKHHVEMFALQEELDILNQSFLQKALTSTVPSDPPRWESVVFHHFPSSTSDATSQAQQSVCSNSRVLVPTDPDVYPAAPLLSKPGQEAYRRELRRMNTLFEQLHQTHPHDFDNVLRNILFRTLSERCFGNNPKPVFTAKVVALKTSSGVPFCFSLHFQRLE
jgi:hypothetical protein